MIITQMQRCQYIHEKLKKEPHKFKKKDFGNQVISEVMAQWGVSIVGGTTGHKKSQQTFTDINYYINLKSPNSTKMN